MELSNANLPATPIRVHIPLCKLTLPTPPITRAGSQRLNVETSGRHTPAGRHWGSLSAGSTSTGAARTDLATSPLAKQLKVALIRLTLDAKGRVTGEVPGSDSGPVSLVEAETSLTSVPP